MRNSPKPLLPRALRANAIFSAATGTALLALANLLAPTLGVSSPWVLRIVGLALLPFAAQVWTLARSRPIPPAGVRQVIGMDVAWVLGSVVLLVVDAVPWTAAGVATLCAVAAVVGGFAVLQALGLRQVASVGRATRAPLGAPPRG